MTVYNSLMHWLNDTVIESGHTNGVFIELEQIPNDYENNAGIFSSPNDEHISLMAGGTKHIEFKSFYYKNKFGTNPDRESNEAFFERFRNKVEERNMNRDFPIDGRRYRSITITGGIFPAQRAQDNQSADYLVPLRIEWLS